MKYLLLLLLAGCPTPTTPTAPDASDAAPPMKDAALSDGGDLGVQVCTHLNVIGCTQPSSCALTFDSKQGTFTDFKPACLLAADSGTQAAGCGTIHCN